MSRTESELASEMVRIFREVHGEIPFTLDFVSDVEGVADRKTLGVCNFSRSPPVVAIRSGLSEADLIDNLCHELAHLVEGYTAVTMKKGTDVYRTLVEILVSL